MTIPIPRSSLALAVALALAGCEREERRFREVPPSASPQGPVTLNDAVQPGPYVIDPEVRNPYERNAWALSEGKVLFESFNCAGCHGVRGGGGMGPALADSAWIYGSEPENIFASIWEGRPNGMPAFRERLSNDQIWKIAAHVRNLAALTPRDARSARDEHIRGTTPAPPKDPEPPASQRIPPEQLAPQQQPR